MNWERFRLNRAGIHQVWQYDEVFRFAEGRLLLRGKNGAGKSKALEMLLPFVLDGDTRRLDAAGGGKTTLKWLMLDGWSGGTNRLGYLWVEFVRAEAAVTLGVAVKASTSTGDARPVFFITGLRVGDELPLHDPQARPTVEQLRRIVGPDNCYDRAADYRARVARDLFGLADPARYHNLVHLLYGLRRPTIGDRIESGELVKVLTEALPPLDDEVIETVARGLDDLDAVRAELARLEATDAALTGFLTGYRGYLRGLLRGRVAEVRRGLAELTRRRRAAGDAERRLSLARERERAAAERAAGLRHARDAADADLRALRESAAYRALGDLRERQVTVRAMAETARARWQAAELARAAEQVAADRSGREAGQIAQDLADLRAALRDARRDCRECGLDEALLDMPPTATTITVAAAGAETSADPEGREVRLDRPALRVVDPAVASGTSAWLARMKQAQQAVRARDRDAAALRERLRRLAVAETAAIGPAREAERLEEQIAEARAREAARGVELVAASRAYAAAVVAWAGTALAGHDTGELRGLVALPPDGPVAEAALPRHAPEEVARVAGALADLVPAECERARDAAVVREGTAAARLAELRRERALVDAQAEPRPPRSAQRAAVPRERGTPLFLLVDFASGLSADEQAGLEAALEAAGVLTALLAADGTLVDPGTGAVLLRVETAVAGPSLADALTPAAGQGRHGPLAAVLRGIGLGESAAHSWVATDGRWRLGVLGGAYGKPRAEYIGTAARELTRGRRTAELDAEIAEAAALLARERAERERLEGARDALRRALGEPPQSRDLVAAWAAYDAALAECARLAEEWTAARRAAEQARARVATLRKAVAAQATAGALPGGAEELIALRAALSRLRDRIGALARDGRRIAGLLDSHASAREVYQEAHAGRVGAEEAYELTRDRLREARRALRLLEDATGADEQEILVREQAAAVLLAEAEQALPAALRAQEEARDHRVRADLERDAAAAELRRQEQAVVDVGSRLRRPLGLPGLVLAAALEPGDGDVPAAVAAPDVAPAAGAAPAATLDAELEAYDAAQEGEVRARVQALGSLADTVEARLGDAAFDVGDTAINNRFIDLRDGLSGGYDAAVAEVDGVKRFELHDDSGVHDVAVVGRRIREAAAGARERLSGREQEVFERYLLGELGEHLSRQVLAAQALVREMNATLEQVRSSHGIGVRLVWEPPGETAADVRLAVDLLRRVQGARTREESALLRDALRRRVEEARLADPGAGYAVHLRVALDYRAWFTFKVMVTDAAQPGRERLLSHRIGLSQGEQRVVSYLVLFATAAAHFTSLGRTTPWAPRLILLDDAFAKVDEPTHGRLLGLLVALDLDFVITSERLWGCFPTVPALDIYECLRDPHARGVATVHFTWDGHRKRLVAA